MPSQKVISSDTTSISDGPYRKSQYEFAEITVRFLCGDSPVAEPEHATAKIKVISRNCTAVRHSKRLRQVKEHGERRKITVTKLTTIKDIKMMVGQQMIFNLELMRPPSYKASSAFPQSAKSCITRVWNWTTAPRQSAHWASSPMTASIFGRRPKMRTNSTLRPMRGAGRERKGMVSVERCWEETLLVGS